MLPYGLSPDVHVCLSGDYFVFLDLNRDRYFALEASKTGDLGRLVRGWPIRDRSATSSSRNVIHELTQKGLIVASSADCKEATPIEFEMPVSEHLDADVNPRLCRASVAAMLVSSLTAAISLRYRSLDRIANRIRRRRQTSDDHRSLDIDEIKRLVSVFDYLRPFFFSARHACLLQSLALIEFLSRSGFFPSWVFGVRTEPFEAHCWVQQGGVVLNDAVDHVRRYSPIMIV
jgi:hypothetical protein